MSPKNHQINLSRWISILLVIILINFNPVAYADSFGRVIADSVITMEVKVQLLADINTKGLSINVVTENGIVTLSGVVPSQKGAMMAVILASATEGVKDVNTKNLVIENTSMPLRDMFLTAKVKGALIKEKTLKNRSLPVAHVHVVSRDASVYLTGEVKNQQQSDEVSAVVTNVKGVTKVINKLEIDEDIT